MLLKLNHPIYGEHKTMLRCDMSSIRPLCRDDSVGKDIYLITERVLNRFEASQTIPSL